MPIMIADKDGGSLVDLARATSSTSSGSSRRKAPSREEAKVSDFVWQKELRTEMRQWLRKLGPQLGLQDFVLPAQFDADWDIFLGDITQFVHTNFQPQHSGLDGADLSDFERARGNPTSTSGPTFNGKVNPHDPQGLQYIFEQARAWAGNRYGADAASMRRASGGGGGGRGRGSSGPTAQDIRNMFDVEELTDAVTAIGRGMLVEEVSNARQIAAQYIEEQVKHRGQKEIDFTTFVERRLEKTGRYKQLYRNKPEGMDYKTYIAPYIAAAQQALGGGQNVNEFGDVVAGGAALGASPSAFANRLRRTDQVRNSSSFITGVEDRMSRVSNVLRG